MLDHRCRVLLIEDDWEDIETIRTLLHNAQSAMFSQGFELSIAQTFANGQTLLIEQNFDVVLLDLMLPDSRGTNTLSEMRKVVPGVAIIVQTALEDDTVAVQALELGACGYLPKTKLDSRLLVYAIRAAIERRSQIASLEQSQTNRQAQELQTLEDLMTTSSDLSLQQQSLEALRQRMPNVFEEQLKNYERLLEQALEQQIYQVEYELSRSVELLAQQLGYLQAIPRDLIELHTKVLKQKIKNANATKAQAYTTEGRYLLLELMGKLTIYYRKYYVGLNKINLSKSYNDLFSV